MSNWTHLKSIIKWPKGFLYVVENEGTENKFGFSFIIKFNGNVIKKKLTEELKKINNLTEFIEDRCKEFEFEIEAENEAEEEEEEGLEDETKRNIYLLNNSLNYTHNNNNNNNDTSENDFNIQEANQILLRLHDKKKFIEEQLNTTHFIDHKYDIVLKDFPNFLFRLDNPLLNITYDPLLGLLKKYYDDMHNMIERTKKRNIQNTKKKETMEFKSYLYNIKIIESDETIIDGKNFIFTESGTSDLKIKLLVQEGKNIQKHLLQYKLDYDKMINDEESSEESELKNSIDGINDKKDFSKEQKKNTDEKSINDISINEKKKNKKKNYEELSILPYCDILILKKQTYNKETDVAGFLTPFLINGNIQKMIKNVDHYLKYTFDNQLILQNLCNIIKVMSYLENQKISHGNITPSNLFISNDGFHLLIGNFVPFQKLQTFYYHVINKQRKIPKYISPEFYFYLKKKRKIQNPKKKKITHLQKYLVQNDIFCLGLSFYYILTMTDDILTCIDVEQAFNIKIQNLTKYISIPKLHHILKAMLSYVPKNRTNWNQILNLVNDTKESFQWTNIFPF